MSITGGTWTYSGNPSASSLDQVRFLVGDTDGNDQLLSDEEILWTIDQEPNVYKAAAMGCRHVVVSGRLYDKRIGDLFLSGSQRARQFEDKAKALERRSALRATPYTGGISQSDMRSVENNTDRVVSAFKIGMHDNPGSRSTST